MKRFTRPVPGLSLEESTGPHSALSRPLVCVQCSMRSAMGQPKHVHETRTL